MGTSSSIASRRCSRSPASASSRSARSFLAKSSGGGWVRATLMRSRTWALRSSSPVSSSSQSFSPGRSPVKTMGTSSPGIRPGADVPVGCYLSGGLDSSLTAALGRRVKGESFRTFSVRFEDAEYDETPYQRAVARRIGSDHRELLVGRRDIAEAFPAVVAHAERPLLRAARRRSSCSPGWSATRGSRSC